MKFMVGRISPRAGVIEPLSSSFSAHSCTRGREFGLESEYPTREAATAEAERFQAYVHSFDPSYDPQYRAVAIAE